MAEQITAAEAKVRKLNELRHTASTIETWQRDHRLGRKAGSVRLVRFPFNLVRPDPMEEFPREVAQAFYQYLTDRASALRGQIRELTDELARMEELR